MVIERELTNISNELAKQTDLGRNVVVKVMHDHVASDPKFRERFQREMLLMARFQHPYVVALYDDQTKTIYLSDKWAGSTPAELSVLVHEMVHHLQNEAGTTYECPAEREKLAYEVQDKWLGLFGRNLEGEFEINGLALLVSTSCAMAIGLH